MSLTIKKFDFGAEDARNLALLSNVQKDMFLRSFVVPEALELEEFYNGQKIFVYGGKGSGKTALLQYIRLSAEQELGAYTHFYYFQSTFSESDLTRFREVVAGRGTEEIVNDTLFQADEDASVFWRVFLHDQIVRLLKRAKVQGNHSDEYYRAVEAAKLISRSAQNRKKYPSLEAFQIKLSKDPHIQLDGAFSEAEPEDLNTYLDIAEDALDEVYLKEVPIFLFVDEMEIYKRGDKGDHIQIAAISSLIRSIRDFSERFPESDIRIIAAIRQEIVDEVSEVKYETHRIVRDRGIEIDWPKTVKMGYHPLERTILNRMAVQDPHIDTSEGINDNEINIVRSKYFQEGCLGKKLLDLTWYRPRDMALLFEIAKQYDGSKNLFLKKTLTVDCVPSLGTRLWQDAKSGLAVKYDAQELKGIDRLLRGGKRDYTRPEWIERLTVLRDQDDYVAQLADQDWEDILSNLYKVGVIFYIAETSGYKNFFFRGDPMPTFSSAFRVGVHRSLRNELALT